MDMNPQIEKVNEEDADVRRNAMKLIRKVEMGDQRGREQDR